MAESEFRNLDHRAPLAQAEVRRVGDGWADVGGRVERLDATTNFHAEAMPPSEPVTLPPAPSETELRERLRAALEVHAAADAVLAEAEAACSRASEHHARATAVLAGYADIDELIASHITEALRAGGRAELPEHLHEQRGLRDRARAEAEAAAAAEATLAIERDTARAAAEEAVKSVNTAIATVLSLEADRLAREHFSLLRRARAITSALFAYDRVVTPSGVHEPHDVLAILRADGRFARDYNTGAWKAAADRLRGDPGADITIAIVEPPIIVPAARGAVVHARKIEEPEAEVCDS